MKKEINYSDSKSIHNIWTDSVGFYGKTNPIQLVEKYGSPLYVYSESILRKRCNQVKEMIQYPDYKINYSAKANTNLSLLKIVRDEGLLIDAMSPGEIFLELEAGFKTGEILFIGNNVSSEEMLYAINKGILTSVDSMSQLDQYGKLDPGGKVVIRINPGIGVGHNEKVTTGGWNTKFGIDPAFIDDIKLILAKYNLHLIGLSQHIGSLFMNDNASHYIDAAEFLLSYAANFPEIEFVDFGGGFGIPYRKGDGELPLNLKYLGIRLEKIVKDWIVKNDRNITIKIEPGRFIVAECGVLLGKVHSIKVNCKNDNLKKAKVQKKYIGTDVGFNVLLRPVLYNSHHDIEIYSVTNRESSETELVTIVGNICESGDIIAKDRDLPIIIEDDILGILDSGAYGLAMSSNYNCRLRPAEVLITSAGEDILIRKREVLDDLFLPFKI
ncbi:MAG: diaminopimelate decarboxylase [Lentimicrobiaceae bacterium]|jgi:diaminopimelate decarboxylase